MSFHKLALLLGLVLFGAPLPSVADEFPNRPIRLIVPFGVGGPTDVVGRMLADKLAAVLKQPVVVENRGGAGGAIGTQMVARAKPDGYTVGLATASTHEFTPACSKTAYHPVDDFEMIGLISTSPVLVYVTRNSSFAGLGDILAASRREPGKYTWGTAGVCSITHILVELVNKSGQGRIVPVPYQGNNAATTDLIAGNITLASDAVTPTSLGLVTSGTVRPLAIIGRSDIEALKTVPPLRDFGIDVGTLTVWQGLVAPAKTPASVVARLNAALREALADPELRRRWQDDGITPYPDNRPEALRQLVQAGYETSRKLVAELGISPK
jgi:tripartite-type tricarboxylate transporter receptor subunit TctC